MSIRLMNTAWDLPLDPPSKLVLLSLADQSNDDGVCWPSMSTLVVRTGLAERTVRYHIGALIEAGHLSRHERPGRSNWFTVHPLPDGTPATDAPRQQVPPTPATGAPHPGTTCPQNHHVTTKEPPLGERKRSAAARGRRWKAGEKVPGQWREWAVERTGWAMLTVSRMAEEFENYWRAKPGAGGVKIDWEATWHNWVLREVKQNEAHGRSGGAGRRTKHEANRDAIARWLGDGEPGV